MCFYDWTSASANIPHICTKVHIPIPKLQTFRVQVGRPCASPPSSKEVRVLYFAAQKTGASKGYVFGGYLDRLFVNLVSFCFLFWFLLVFCSFEHLLGRFRSLRTSLLVRGCHPLDRGGSFCCRSRLQLYGLWYRGVKAVKAAIRGW